MLLPHPQAIRLLQPGLHHPNLDLGEPPAEVCWGALSCGGSWPLKDSHQGSSNPLKTRGWTEGDRVLTLSLPQVPTLRNRG